MPHPFYLEPKSAGLFRFQPQLKASLVSRKWLDTRSVIPAKAGIQLTLLWIPAYAGKTIVGRKRRAISPM